MDYTIQETKHLTYTRRAARMQSFITYLCNRTIVMQTYLYRGLCSATFITHMLHKIYKTLHWNTFQGNTISTTGLTITDSLIRHSQFCPFTYWRLSWWSRDYRKSEMLSFETQGRHSHCSDYTSVLTIDGYNHFAKRKICRAGKLEERNSHYKYAHVCSINIAFLSFTHWDFWNQLSCCRAQSWLDRQFLSVHI